MQLQLKFGKKILLAVVVLLSIFIIGMVLLEANVPQNEDAQLRRSLLRLEHAKNEAEDARSKLLCYENYNNENYAVALEMCHLVASKSDDSTAQKWLGFMYAEGNGPEKDIGKAIAWLHKAANQGERLAQWKLGYIYDTAYDSNEVKDDKKAFTWYLKAAEQGFDGAQFGLGLMYLSGRGGEQSDKKSFEWFMKAAVQGFSGAQNQIGVMYYKGIGIDKDEKMAVEWLRKAAAQGFEMAKTNLTDIGY